jgi:hypothetical protein
MIAIQGCNLALFPVAVAGMWVLDFDIPYSPPSGLDFSIRQFDLWIWSDEVPTYLKLFITLLLCNI